MQIFQLYVKPILIYASPSWSPWQRYLLADIESVQRRFTKCLQKLSNLSYSDRLRYLDLLSLKSTHIEADLITTYKIVHNLISIVLNEVGLSLSKNKTRSARRKFEHKVHHSNIIASKYMHKLTPFWKSLPDGLITANKLSAFKKQIRSWLKDIDFNFIN